MFEFLQEYGVQIIVASAGGMTLMVANRARSFLKHLTVDKIVDFAEQLVDRYTKDEESRDKLNTILTVVSNLPIVRKFFKDAQSQGLSLLDAKIHELEGKILDYEIKLENDVVSQKLRAKVMENIKQLKEDKAKLVALYEEQQGQ